MLRVGVGSMRFESSNVVEETSERPLEKRIPEIIEALKREAAKLEEMRVRDAERQRAFAEQERSRLLAQQQKEEEAARQTTMRQILIWREEQRTSQRRTRMTRKEK